jgi:hypothetical protein
MTLSAAFSRSNNEAWLELTTSTSSEVLVHRKTPQRARDDTETANALRSHAALVSAE